MSKQQETLDIKKRLSKKNDKVIVREKNKPNREIMARSFYNLLKK